MIRMNMSIDSIIMHQPIPCLVILPCSVMNASKPMRVMWALHPAMSSAEIFSDKFAVAQYLERSNVAFIAPSLQNSFFINSVLGQYADFLDAEFVPLLRKLFPLSQAKEDNFCLGISMGAYGALSWALRKPEMFRACHAISGYYDSCIARNFDIDRSSAAMSNILKPIMKMTIESNLDAHGQPISIVRELEKFGQRDSEASSAFSLRLYCGKKDGLTLNQNRRLYELCRDTGWDVLYHEVAGAHDAIAWRDSLDIVFGSIDKS